MPYFSSAAPRLRAIRRLATSYLGTLWCAERSAADGAKARVLLLRLPLPEGASEARHAIVSAAHTTCDISHPNVLPTLEVLETESEVHVVYEYADAKPLRALLTASHEGVPIGVALRIVLDIVEGLERFHDLPSSTASERISTAAYGGLSPDSVLVTKTGVTKLCNLPLASAACMLEAFGAHPDKLAYAAPEQTSPGARLTPRADVFSVGALLWELLAGRPLLQGLRSEIERTLRAGDFPELPSGGTGAGRIPAGLVGLVSAMLNADPNGRPGAARELDSRLRKCGCPIATHRAVAKLLAERLVLQESGASASPAPRARLPMPLRAQGRAEPGLRDPSLLPARSPVPAAVAEPAELSSTPPPMPESVLQGSSSSESSSSAAASSAAASSSTNLPSSAALSEPHALSLPPSSASAAPFLSPRRWILLSSGVVVIVAGAIAHRFLPEPDSGFDTASLEEPPAAAELASGVAASSEPAGPQAADSVDSEPSEPPEDVPSLEPTPDPADEPASELPPLTEPASALDPTSLEEVGSLQPTPTQPTEPPGSPEPASLREPSATPQPPSLPEPPAGGASDLAQAFRAGKLSDEQLTRAFALEHTRAVPPCPQLPGTPAASAKEPSEEAAAHLASARDHLVRGELERARSELCAVLTLDPGNSEARRDLAELALGWGDAARAKQIAEEGLSESDPDPELLGIVGDAWAMLGELEESRRVWLPLAQPHGSKAERIRRLTSYFLRLGKTAYDGRAFARARSLYRRAVILSSGSFLSSMRLAEALGWMGEEQAALVWARRAAGRMYRGWRAQMVLGDALSRTGDAEGAREQWEKALRLHPRSKPVARRLRNGVP